MTQKAQNSMKIWHRTTIKSTKSIKIKHKTLAKDTQKPYLYITKNNKAHENEIGRAHV